MLSSLNKPSNIALRFPPHDNNYEVKSRSSTAPVEIEILNLMPHMHLRGKSFSYTLVKPDNSREVLLEVPAYDFNWQNTYRLAEPKTVPAGGYIECVAHFDNSSENFANPDPTSTVKWGDQTDDEMMIGYFDIVVDKVHIVGDESAGRLSVTPKKRIQSKLAEVMFLKLDSNKDKFISRDELTNPKHKAYFKLFDVDKNDKLTQQELEAGLAKLEKLRN
ncbi:hypothetical protein OAF24_00885 [bacterium]|nr:hypothetical protein [bacterium]